MAISAASYMTLARTLLTTLNKYILQGLFKTGVQSKHILTFTYLKLIISFRCTALPTDLDGFADRRSQQFHQELVQELDSRTLWDEYGVDDDITVCALLHYSSFERF
jgi:hypothetical protein